MKEIKFRLDSLVAMFHTEINTKPSANNEVSENSSGDNNDKSYTVLKEASGFNQSYCRQIDFGGYTFDSYIMEDSKNIHLFWKRQNEVLGDLTAVKQLLEEKDLELVFATNGGMYKPSQAPQGLYVENGELLAPLDLSTGGYGNFYMQPNGVFFIDEYGRGKVIDSREYGFYEDHVLHATQSGPMLLKKGDN